MDWHSVIHKDTARVATDNCRPGDEVRVWFKIFEQDKERLAQFEGVLMRSRGAAGSRTITVRRVTYGEGVERNFPLHPKVVSKVEVLRRGKIKRSRLYFLRAVVGKTRIASAEQQAQTAKATAAGSSPEVQASAERLSDAAEAAKTPS